MKEFIPHDVIRDSALKLAYKMYKEDHFIPDVIYVSLRGGVYMANVFSEFYKMICLREHRRPVLYAAVVARSYNVLRDQTRVQVDGWTYSPKYLRAGDKVLLVDDIFDTGNTVNALATVIMDATGDNLILLMLVILWVSAILSAILDNIPFVATMIPLVLAMEANGINVIPLWWAISLGACLGGNGTLIGASANVVLTGISGKHGHPISFIQFTKVGFPMMVISVIAATVYLLLRYGL